MSHLHWGHSSVKNKIPSGLGLIRREFSLKATEPTHCSFSSVNCVSIFKVFFNPEPGASLKRFLTFNISFCYEVLQYLNVDPTRRTSATCEHRLVPKGKIHDPDLWRRSSGTDTGCCSLLTTPKTDSQTAICKSSAHQPCSGLLKNVWLTHTHLHDDSAHIKSF